MIASLLTLVSLASAANFPVPASFDASAMDRKADPCGDFYQYSCGGWLSRSEIPADQSQWSRFHELEELTLERMRDILVRISSAGAAGDALDRKLGDYWTSCMDESGLENQGTAPLKAELEDVMKLTRDTLPGLLGRLHRSGVNAAFGFGQQQDFRDSEKIIASADQAGLGLPERDYYFKDDAKSAQLRKDYVAHVAKMLELLGSPVNQAAADAQAVMDFEVRLASVSQTNVFRRDPRNLDHRMTPAELKALAPGFDWDAYFKAAAVPSFDAVNVLSPEFVREIGAMTALPPDRWKPYLRWRLVAARAPLMSKSFVNENFRFYGQTLRGTKELKARWKRCVDRTDEHMGEALGRRYVEAHFGPNAKKRMLAMVARLEQALESDIKTLDWMTPATKKRALEKLGAMTHKIGYPDKWRDYSALEIVRGDAVGNAARAARFEWDRQLAKIGKPLDRTEWLMTPPTVNAYYDGQMNNINFPAGILQPPFFDEAASDGVNYGAIGGVIGHELTHGFDDEGRRFDAKGNVTDWWTAADSAAFDKRAACFADQYGSYVAVDDLKVNGKLTLGENVADNGGLRLAHMALPSKSAKDKDGFTEEQKLFVGWAQGWCWKKTDQDMRLMVLTNPHSPAKFRVNGVMVNMPEFAKAFRCQAGAPMAPAKSCRAW